MIGWEVLLLTYDRRNLVASAGRGAFSSPSPDARISFADASLVHSCLVWRCVCVWLGCFCFGRCRGVWSIWYVGGPETGFPASGESEDANPR